MKRITKKLRNQISEYYCKCGSISETARKFEVSEFTVVKIIGRN